ncbi:polysaccharide biosynthesis tyrosine autokinase [Luteipulveratus halotolerans]|uniref:polysaccharide biosynthesis tyrosine autokinase n=1 Tax=Luteipulveratus halotolerans TaxID=1631356 RepID=UPI0008FC09ED|nr:polysaccharide biosynthesis tyrosine autokinase [Luteipulveratus halotolerans]
MTLEDFWKLTRRYWVLLLGFALLGLLCAGAYTLTRTKQYTATATAFVVAKSSGDDTGSAYAGSMLAQTKAKAWLPLFKSTPVASRAAQQLGLPDSPTAIASRVSTSLTDETPAITVTATAPTPAGARSLADAVVNATAQQVQQIEGAGGAASIRPVQTAELPTRPSFPRPERTLPLGVLGGLLVGYAVALVRHRQDTRIRSSEQLEQQLSTSVLAVLPTSKALSRREDGRFNGDTDFHTREALRQLRTNLRFVDVDHSPRSIVVTSARMGEGKSTIASSLASVLAQSGQSVLLVDADLRRPAISTIFDVDSAIGLTQVLAGTLSFADAVQSSGVPGLSILAAGQIPPNPSELLGSHRMSRLIAELSADHMVILDAPPLLPVTDAALLTASCDGALIVVAAGETHEEHVKRIAANLRRVDGKVLGAVLNRVNTRRLREIVYGDQRYGQGAYGEYGETAYVQATADPGARGGGSKAFRGGPHRRPNV